jgi:hypothetical protein
VTCASRSYASRWVAILLVLAMSACGRTAEDHLRAVSENLDRIRSGVLDMRLAVSAVSAPDEPIGFAIQGPFEVAGESLEADLTYRQIAGTTTAEVRFVAAEGRAFVETEGNVYELPVAQDPSPAMAPTALEDLGFERWAADPTVQEGGTDDHLTIVSPLDEVAALEGIGRLLDDLEMKEASGLAVLDGLDDETLERSVEGGSMTVRVGPDDLLHALVVRLRFGIDPSSPLANALEGVVGAELVFSVDITNPNRPVHVALPHDPLPISELPGS